ncbi:unnamed protein product [Adineta steineri]|uniref:CMP/dCMP-type deaminase domain-containing protein n=1 Tax=Adineta steineri TaxID=433720 RepID=A0A818W2T1_9BILA|nr:unnamed protein product [Adineta steineri]CAF3719684.1 unnamed protein product [Adineta steineri]
MEAKLAEFRKSHAQKQPSINWRTTVSRLTSIFSNSAKQSFETNVKKDEDESEESVSVINWQIILIKFFVWLTLFIIFIRIEFGAVYFIISLLYIIWSSLSAHRRRSNELSAYSVFNPNCEKIQGTFSAEDYDQQLRRGVKRLCNSSVIKYHWRPVVDDEYLRLPNFQSMIVAHIKDRRLTPEIISLINNIYPWTTSLKHIRRIHNSDILLYPLNFQQPLQQDLFEKYFDNETKIMNIPENPCLLKWQYDKCIKEHWSNIIFRENKIIEQSQLKKDLTENDEIILDLLKKIQDNDQDSHCAIIVDNEQQIPLVGTRDYRHEHPLQHSTMVAIDLLAANSIYSRENFLEKFLEKKEKKAYLLNGCSIYLTHEPCIMCAMALLHSRISNVYYLKENQHVGALGSKYKLHTLKKTNHRFTVYQLEQINLTDNMNTSE